MPTTPAYIVRSPAVTRAGETGVQVECGALFGVFSRSRSCRHHPHCPNARSMLPTPCRKCQNRRGELGAVKSCDPALYRGRLMSSWNHDPDARLGHPHHAGSVCRPPPGSFCCQPPLQRYTFGSVPTWLRCAFGASARLAIYPDLRLTRPRGWVIAGPQISSLPKGQEPSPEKPTRRPIHKS